MTTVDITRYGLCDGCGVTAYVVVDGPDGEFKFCAHDYYRHEIALIVEGYSIIADHRDELSDVSSPKPEKPVKTGGAVPTKFPFQFGNGRGYTAE